MDNNIATLQRELNVYLMEGNDYMVNKIQKLIDNELKKRKTYNLNEVVEKNESEIRQLNEN